MGREGQNRKQNSEKRRIMIRSAQHSQGKKKSASGEPENERRLSVMGGGKGKKIVVMDPGPGNSNEMTTG